MLLREHAMKNLVAAGALVTACVISNTASAGTYVGLGIGTAPSMGEAKDRLDAGGRSGKLFVGTRFGQFAAEGGIGRFGVLRLNNDRFIDYGDAYQGFVAAKLSLALGNNFEAFGRAGLHKTWMGADPLGTSGSGFLIGAGMEYRLNLAVGQGSIFVDYQFNSVNDLSGDRIKFDQASYRMFTIGATIGL